MKDMIMDIMKLAQGMLVQKLGGNSDAVGSALNSLLGQGNTMDLASLVSGFKDKGMGDMAESWLGDGKNAPVSVDQLKEVLGGEKIAQAASQLGTDEGSLLSGLQDALPQMVDKASSGGSLLDAVGGVGGLANMAKKFL